MFVELANESIFSNVYIAFSSLEINVATAPLPPNDNNSEFTAPPNVVFVNVVLLPNLTLP